MAYNDETYGNALEAALAKMITRHAVGEPWSGTRIETKPAGVLLTDGGLQSRGLYAGFYSWLVDKGVVKTDAEWQFIYANQGYCEWYSDGDGSSTFRMPLVPTDNGEIKGVWAVSTAGVAVPDANAEEILAAVQRSADTDLSNLTSAGKEVAAKASMPSSRREDITVGANGANYTAPATGTFHVTGTASSASGFVIIYGRDRNGMTANSGRYGIAASCSCAKGEMVQVYYGNMSDVNLVFFYAEGAE